MILGEKLPTPVPKPQQLVIDREACVFNDGLSQNNGMRMSVRIWLNEAAPQLHGRNWDVGVVHFDMGVCP